MATKTEFQIAILADKQHSLKEPVGAFPIEWLTCERRGDGWLDFYGEDGLVSAIDLDNPVFDLPMLLGVVAIGGDDAFVDVETKWTSALPSSAAAFRRVPPSNSLESNSENLLRAAIEFLADHLAAQRRHAGRAALDLAVYRREFDRVQRSFSRLEEYVGRHVFQRPNEVFEYSPGPANARGSRPATEIDAVNGSVNRFLTQILPVDSLGVSSLSLCVTAKPENREDLLRVRLRAIETGEVYGEWPLSGEDSPLDANGGWVELALDRAIDEAALSLALEVEWPSADSGWGLALGPPNPYEEFCAEVANEQIDRPQPGAGRHLRAPLSLRIFSGLPGVRVAATTAAIRPAGAPYLLASFIAHEACAAVEQVLPHPAEGKPALVSYDPEIGCITVHPRVGGLSVARLKVNPAANAWRISAQVHLAHELASPTYFGLLAGLPREELKDLAQLDRLNSPSPSFSGWTKVAPLEARSISVVFASPPEEALSVYLLTRQDPESSPDFGWARFSKLEFNLLRRSASAQDARGATDAEPANEAGIKEFASRADEVSARADEVVTAAAE